MKTLHHSLAFVLGLTLAAGPCFADSSASAALSNVHITLADLNPNDGVTPALSLDFGSQPYLNSAIGSYGPNFQQSAFAHLGKDAAGTVTDSIQAPFANSYGTMTGANNVAGVTSMLVSGSAVSGVLGHGEFGSLAGNYAFPTFTLSPYTSITITMDASISALTTLGYDPVTGAAEFASSHVELVFDGHTADGTSLRVEDIQSVYVDASVNADGTFTGAQQSWSGTLSVTFTNASSQELIGSFYSEADAGGSSMNSPVPEPSSSAMLAAGLGALVWMARRRTSDSSKLST